MSEPQCSSLGKMLRKYSEVFNDELGTLKDIKASIIVKADVPPKFCRHRSLSFAIKERVQKEFKMLEEANIISPVNRSDWAAPIVPVEKRDKSLLLCVDYKETVNQAFETDTPCHV